MKYRNGVVCIVLISCLLVLIQAPNSLGKPAASMKFSSVREENPRPGGQETLILPYAFPSDSMGTTIGVGGLRKGFFQDQLLLAGTLFGSVDSAYGAVLGMWDLAVLPSSDRFYFSAIGSVGHYPRQKAYTELDPVYGIRTGSNDSDKDDYVEQEGDDNWWEMKLEYVLPIGAMSDSGMATYKLKNGILAAGATGGEQWNPLASGATMLVLRQFNRYQNYETEVGDIEGTIHPLEFGILYNNTDFYSNPSTGSSQYLSFTKDFAWLDSEETWTFLEFEASKYFSFGSSDHARQRVVALNLWTGSSPSWETSVDENGGEIISHNPPFLEGAKLGGFYRFRAYPNNRFNDRSVLYTTAEYRYTPKWNPIGEVSWLRWLKMDWMQLVAFVEGGRVADEYSDLFSDWKGDVGFGFRAMMAGAVVRFDYAVSEEGSAGWVMFGQPF